MRAYAEELVEQIGPAVAALAKRQAERRAAAIAEKTRECTARPLLRERHLSGVVRLAEGSLVQAGLFDTRTLKHHEETERQRRNALEDVRRRADALTGIAHCGGDGARNQAPANPMLTGLSGGLLSHYFAERLVGADFAGKLGEAFAPQAHRQLCRWWRERGSQLGPASTLRAVSDQAALPVAEILGFEVQRDSMSAGEARVALRVGLWDDSLDGLWRDAVRAGISFQSSWCLCTNGHELRLVDAARTYSRAYVQFDLERVVDDPQAFAVLWGVLRADAFRGGPSGIPLIGQILQQSARHGAAVSRSVANRRRGRGPTAALGLLEPSFTAGWFQVPPSCPAVSRKR